MSVKYIDLPDIGSVGFYKKRGLKAIKLSVNSNGDIRVSLPQWIPYKSAISFAMGHKQWISEHQAPVIPIKTGARLGKSHYFKIIKSDVYQEIVLKVAKDEVRIYCPTDTDDNLLTLKHPKIQKVANRILKKEAEMILPERIADLAARYDFTFNNLKIRHLKSRWGSCNQKKDITLNYFLVQLPWDLIDYVLIHELSHTIVLSHGETFWNEVVRVIPDWKVKRRRLREYQPSALLQGQALE